MSRSPMIGQALERLEDARFLSGSACFVDDVKRPRLAHAVVVRSALAHARIKSVDTSAAKALPGVLDVLAFADIAAAVKPIPLWANVLPGFERFAQMPIARDRVVYVGEPVAVVIAEDRYLAEDAADLVSVDYDPLDAVVDVEASRAGHTLVHPAQGTNIATSYTVGRGDAEAAFARASYRRKELLKVHRHSAVPLETRGLVAEWDAKQRRMQVWGATKLLFRNRTVLAGMLGLSEAQVEMLEVDVGGGFGVRGEFYPEDFLVPLAAMRLGRPVKWIEDRREHLMATNHSREMQCELEIGVDPNGTILALRGRLMVDLGAWVRPNGGVGPGKLPQFMCGPYRIEHASFEINAFITNKTPFGSYRGPGRYESTYFRERMVDIAATDLGIDPAEFRRRNLIGPDRMPWDAGSMVHGHPPTVYDTGDYPKVMARALKEFGYEGLRASRGREVEGRVHGVGMGCFVESTGGGPAEGVRLVVPAPGRVELYTGTSTMGHGHETTLAQILADELSIAPRQIAVMHGSTTFVEKGWGTYHSRSVVMAGSAIVLAARKLREQILPLVAARRGVLVGQLQYAPEMLGELAEVAREDATVRAALEAAATYSSDQLTYTFGTQLAHVAVDIETGKVEVVRFLSVEDVGRMINPAIVHGQTLGASVQGLGGTFLDQFVYDDTGQLLTGSFADYLLPTSTDFPNVEAIALEESPALNNPLGVKGAGEGGIVATGAALSNAVADALRSLGVTIRELPLSPNNLAQLIRERKRPEQ